MYWKDKVARAIAGYYKSSRSIGMYGSVEVLECRRGFQSSVSSLSPNKESEIPQEMSEVHDHGCSPSVQLTPEIERKYVHRVYDAIAPHFSSTRFAKWPKVAQFLNSLTPGSVILDAGCGNGKYLGFNPNCLYIGCDISAPLINICAEREHEVIVADAVNLPYRTGFGDAAISIAVLHHLSTDSRRRKAIEDLVRVVRKGGLVLVTVWAVEQEDKSLLTKWTPLSHRYDEEWIGPSSPRVRSALASNSLERILESDENGCQGVNQLKRDSVENLELCKKKFLVEDDPTNHKKNDLQSHQEYFIPWHLPYHRAEVTGASAIALENGLAKKDDKKGAVVYNRYYHVFIEGELERLVSGIDNAVVVERFFDKSNWCIILQKT